MTDASPPRRREGGRNARVREAVRDAAKAELLQNGILGLSHRAVADRAGVDPSTVYRRWPTRADLLADILVSVSDDAVAIPDTGTLESDLTAYLEQVATALSNPVHERLVRWAMAAGDGSDETADAAIAAFWTHRFQQAMAVIDRASERGEAGLGLDGLRLIERLVAPVWFRLLVLRKPVDKAFVKDCVAEALSTHPVT
ncbi:hypothetical protein EKPJFOCH_4243 [Methylobacterium thuringiense]|uniref:HTH tetR-type domain-containing protein n=1 Tax=Methylobacterium thuringiense TaxID=1003091 RepID=A0ABQ4TVU5_9HYPH|nr:hypothetical protein EKPJFOCH_4243 [Methylobacterium thuringiense]